MLEPIATPAFKITPEDIARIGAKIREAFRPLREWFERFGRWIARWHDMLVEAANTTVNVAGLCARYYVRAGLDQTYRTPEALDALVASIMGGHEDELAFLTLTSRAQVAAAAITSWDHSYGAGTPVVAWHRLMGSTTLTVGHAA